MRTPQRTRIVPAPPESRINHALAQIDVEARRLRADGNTDAVDVLLDLRLTLTATVEVPR